MKQLISDENKIILQRLENVEKRASVPGQVGSTVPPATSSRTRSSSVFSSAGCELVIGSFSGNELGDILVAMVSKLSEGIPVVDLEEIYSRGRRPRVSPLRFKSTAAMFQSSRALKRAGLRSEQYGDLWAGVDRSQEERERSRHTRVAGAAQGLPEGGLGEGGRRGDEELRRGGGLRRRQGCCADDNDQLELRRVLPVRPVQAGQRRFQAGLVGKWATELATVRAQDL